MNRRTTDQGFKISCNGKKEIYKGEKEETEIKGPKVLGKIDPEKLAPKTKDCKEKEHREKEKPKQLRRKRKEKKEESKEEKEKKTSKKG